MEDHFEKHLGNFYYAQNDGGAVQVSPLVGNKRNTNSVLYSRSYSKSRVTQTNNV